MTLIPHDALILVCDGSRAKLLTNRGRPDAPVLEVVEAWEAPENPPGHAQGSGPRGRVFQSADGRRSAVEAPDLHEAAERRFVQEAADRLVAALKGGNARAVVVAPPRALAVLRARMGPDWTGRVAAEIDKDLTRHSLPDMARILAAG